MICDIGLLFVRSHEARPSSVTPKLELWGDSQHCCPPTQNFGGDSPSLSPHDLRHCMYCITHGAHEMRSLLLINPTNKSKFISLSYGLAANTLG